MSDNNSNPSASDYRIETYDDFWPIYLREHLDPTCRYLHYIGSSLGLICLFLLVVTGELSWLLVGIVIGYGCAWTGHFVFEKNKPATFKFFRWSFISDWKMFAHFLRGDLDQELERVKNLPALKDITL